jgi:hypothetical protein
MNIIYDYKSSDRSYSNSKNIYNKIKLEVQLVAPPSPVFVINASLSYVAAVRYVEFLQ